MDKKKIKVNNPPQISHTENHQENKINRRQFLLAGAATGLSGALFSLSSSSPTNLSSSIKANFPIKITDKCKRMNQKYTIFNRELWDYELVKKIEERASPSDQRSKYNEKGWTHLDFALDAAGWAVDHKFAAGSEGGQPQSSAYVWDEPVNRRKFKFKDAKDASQKIKKAARFLGASLVGIADYDPLWTYSQLVKETLDAEYSPHEPPQFELIPPEFPFQPKSVVVMAVEMDYKGIFLSPSAIEGAATGLGYSHMCAVGYSVATFLRQLGYRAFANGNDVSLSIPYGIAAGLGELGRNGLLITKEFGPRVRIVKVFTELELKPDRPKTFGVWQFCKTCKRCAESCPSQAISFGQPTLAGETISNNPGVLKWYINPEKCIQFWRENGSDCANCISSCPYNKLPLWNHKLSSSLAALPIAPLQFLMARMDKLFGYGTIRNSQANAAFWDED